MAEAAFGLQYDGPALVSHEMDVRDLAPALIATAELCQQMSQAMRPTDPPIAVNVRATTEGSFVVQLILVYERTRHVLAGDDVTAAANLAQLVTVLGTFVTLIVHRARSRVAREEPSALPGMIRITLVDGTTIELHKGVLDLEQNLAVRTSLREMVRPLTRDGVEVLRIKQDEVILSEVAKADLDAYDVDELSLTPPEVLLRNSGQEYLTVLSAVFQDDRKWRFTDGEATFSASITDLEFLRRVDGGEPFAKGDLLLAEVERTQTRDKRGLHTDIGIRRVIEHISASTQGVQGELSPPTDPIDDTIDPMPPTD